MRVEIWSDVVCPWCHVGKARFEEALRRLGWEDEVEVVYRPFELDRRVPREGVPLLEYLQQKFGSRATIESIEGRVGDAGAELGLTFEWASVRRANTFDAHRLLAWALDTAGWRDQGRLKRRLMEAYFAEGLDVGDPAVLARLAGEVGLDAAEAAQVLASDAYAEAVRAGEAEAREREIHAVPTFVLGGMFAVPGAQEPETFVSLLARVRQRLEEAEEAALAADAQACALEDGSC